LYFLQQNFVPTQPFALAGTTMLINTSYYLEQRTQLIQECIAGNRASQNGLYLLLAAKMLGVCLRYCKNREEAEDILQEGFIQVFKSLKNFRHEGTLEGWVRKIMVRCAIQHYRSKINIHPVISIDSIKEANEKQTGDEDIMAQLGKKELLQMIQALPPAYRMVFNLYVFEGMKHREIAAQLGISEGTSKSNLFDAKIILQKAVTGSLKVAQTNYKHG
jgi:RNA polymerase sigma-70 factor, ECF subfamily